MRDSEEKFPRRERELVSGMRKGSMYDTNYFSLWFIRLFMDGGVRHLDFRVPTLVLVVLVVLV